MSDVDARKSEAASESVAGKNVDADPVRDAAAQASGQLNDVQRRTERKEAQRWWIKLVVQPLLFVALLAGVIVSLGVAQRFGWITSGSGGGQSQAAAESSATRYICPMMCTPPQTEPGRCPVCAMELVPATSAGGHSDPLAIRVDPAARRVAKIRTVAAESVPMTQTIRAIGEISYDEGTLKTISAYADGRLDALYADYTGVVVNKDDRLALVYSPTLYSSQVELLLAKKAHEDSQSATLKRVIQSSAELYKSSRQRLIELGMTESQIGQLERDGEASSRLHLFAPMSGTVIEKLAVEGEYVKEGQAIYRLADLTTVWLMLELFPKDAAAIRFGQRVEAEVQSLPGRKFTGRVAFVDPNVNPKTRTVGVRVVIPNPNGRLRVGDYAKATIEAGVVGLNDDAGEVYDPELAGMWISPRHPHVVQTEPGECPICGIALVPAAQFGFASEPISGNNALVIPRSAVLMAGNNSVVYVETEPGRFEIRRVVLGPSTGERIVILSGIASGEQVATRGNFLIDSQMQLAGNPSLIDPTKAQIKSFEIDLPPIGPIQLVAPSDIESDAKITAALDKLSPIDRPLAEWQKTCPVAGTALGSMGTPIKMDVDGRMVFICCESCRARLLAEPQKYIAKLPKEANR